MFRAVLKMIPLVLLTNLGCGCGTAPSSTPPPPALPTETLISLIEAATPAPTGTETLQPTCSATPLPTDTATPIPTHTGSGGGVIAYCYQPMSGGSIHQIYAVNLDGSDNRKLIHAPIELNHHDWSPDGSMLIFSSDRAEAGHWEIYVMGADGSIMLLRQDNADLRLAEIGYQAGMLPQKRYQRIEAKRHAVEAELERLRATWLRPGDDGLSSRLVERGLPPLTDGVNALQFLRRPEVDYALVSSLVPPPELLPTEVAEQVQIEAKYAGYIEKQRVEVARFRRLEDRRIPADFRYDTLVGLRTEAREKLAHVRPATVGQATRLAGVNPADISVLLVHLKRLEALRPAKDTAVGQREA